MGKLLEIYQQQNIFDLDTALRHFQDAAARVNEKHNKHTSGEGSAWAQEHHPDLWAACEAAFDAVREAFKTQDMPVIRQAVSEFETVNNKLFDAYIATRHTKQANCPEISTGLGLPFPSTGSGRGDQIPDGEKTQKQGEGELPETLFPATEGAGGEKTMMNQEKPDAGKAPGFVSPWQTWLDRAQTVQVPDLAAWRTVLEEARAAGICAIDTETTGLDPLQNRIRLVQLAVPAYPAGKKRLVAENGKEPEPGGSAKVYVLDLFVVSEPDRREVLETLAGLVADQGVLKVLHNAKFDLAFFRMALGGTRIPAERLFDTMLASQLCTAGDFIPEAQFEKFCADRGIRVEKHGNEKTRYFDRHGHELEFHRDSQKKIRPVWVSHSLQQAAHRHLEVVLAKEHQSSDWSGELTPEMLRYAARDAAVLLPLQEILARLLAANRLTGTAKIEFACLPAVVEIELNGMPFAAAQARGLLAGVEAEAVRHKGALIALAREAGFRARPKKSAGKKYSPDLNPDSGVDCVDCLRLLAGREGVLAKEDKAFQINGETLDLDSRDETLSRLAARLPEGSNLRAFAQNLKAYRSAKKRADFLKQWLEKLHPSTDRLHPDLRQINPFGVGRFSAQNPSLQQVPRGGDTRALFREPEGKKLVVADFSGIEMRIMAQLSGDKNMIAAFKDGADIHRRTAAAIAGKPEGEVTKEERQAAKACGFGLIYGMQASTLRQYAETSYGVKMTPEEAETAREAFFRAYPAIASWHARQEKKMFEGGFETYWRHDYERGYYQEKRPCARTLDGRLRVWPTVEKERKNGNGSYIRKAGSSTEMFNTPDQGTGASMLKCAMARLYRELARRGWNDVRLVATVHDELVLEVPEALAEQAAELLGSVMEYTAARFLPDVPVEVEAAVCETWAEK